jgi:hypothetical protein
MQYWLHEALCHFVEPGHADINTATCKKRKDIILQFISENMRTDFPQ